jgi:hypothetical protein
MGLASGTVRTVLAAVAALAVSACGSDGGGAAMDPGTLPDAVADVPAGDPGPGDTAAEADPAPIDVQPDPEVADVPTQDPDPMPDTALDPVEDEVSAEVAVDPGAGEETTADTWPPSDPWWGEKACKLPACDPGAPAGIDLSGLWTQTLTAVKHDCNPMVETLKQEIKPGKVTTKKDQSFAVQGTCTYDKPGGTVTGVLKGDTMVNCILMPPEQGVTAMPTGWLTFDDGKATGKSTVHLYGIPMLQPTNCSVEYDVTYVRQ